jgi:hypothetical protein
MCNLHLSDASKFCIDDISFYLKRKGGRIASTGLYLSGFRLVFETFIYLLPSPKEDEEIKQINMHA